METFVISKATLDLVVAYLYRCPMQDVEHIVNAIRKDVSAPKETVDGRKEMAEE